VANGRMLGPDQPVILHLLDIEPAKEALLGVQMELTDAALPLLKGERTQQRPHTHTHTYTHTYTNTCMHRVSHSVFCKRFAARVLLQRPGLSNRAVYHSMDQLW